jgi:biotin operon repressor
MSARIDGAFYSPSLDEQRLTTQMERVRRELADGRWHTAQYVADRTHAPLTSVSTQIRNLRKKENGGYVIETRRDGDTGLFLYRMVRGG